MTDNGSVAYALHRLRLAESRLQRWSDAAQSLEDRRDATKSKGWRTRLARELLRADRAYRRAVVSVREWRAEVRLRTERDRTLATKLREEPRRVMSPAAGVTDEGEDVSNEWEIGVDYDAASGAGSDVDVNIRLRRTDGRQFGFAEATRALSALRHNISLGMADPTPTGYQLADISWHNPNRAAKTWRHGDAWEDLGGLQNPLYMLSDIPDMWRLGSVDD